MKSWGGPRSWSLFYRSLTCNIIPTHSTLLFRRAFLILLCTFSFHIPTYCYVVASSRDLRNRGVFFRSAGYYSFSKEPNRAGPSVSGWGRGEGGGVFTCCITCGSISGGLFFFFFFFFLVGWSLGLFIYIFHRGSPSTYKLQKQLSWNNNLASFTRMR
jgi:hypothetical protein